MKGVILNVVQEAVEEHHGLEAWDRLLERAGLDGVYTALGNYPDEDLHAILDAAATELELAPRAVMRWAGRHAFPHLVGRYPRFVVPHDDLFVFLGTINDVIHAEVRKFYHGADCPEFDIRRSDHDVLEMVYRSRRSLCGLAEGLILGAADHFHRPVDVTHRYCTADGEEVCVIEVLRKEVAS